MVTLLTVIHITVCLFLILVVLLQAGKGGGMGIAFGGAGSQTVFGSSGAGNFLTRLTSITATVFLLTSLALAHYSSRQDSKRLQELATQKAAEKKSDDEKAAKLKADMEKIRSAAMAGKDAGAGAATPEAAPSTPGKGSLMPLQLKLPGTPAGPGAPAPAPTEGVGAKKNVDGAKAPAAPIKGASASDSTTPKAAPIQRKRPPAPAKPPAVRESPPPPETAPAAPAAPAE